MLAWRTAAGVRRGQGSGGSSGRLAWVQLGVVGCCEGMVVLWQLGGEGSFPVVNVVVGVVAVVSRRFSVTEEGVNGGFKFFLISKTKLRN